MSWHSNEPVDQRLRCSLGFSVFLRCLNLFFGGYHLLILKGTKPKKGNFGVKKQTFSVILKQYLNYFAGGYEGGF